MGRRSQTERKRKPAHSGRDDSLVALAHRLALPGRVRDAAGLRLIGYVIMPEHLDFANPVRRGLVNHPKDWTWSNWAYYFGAENPLLLMDV